MYFSDSSDAEFFDDDEFDSDAELQNFPWPDHLNFGQMGLIANYPSGDESSNANTESTGYDSGFFYDDDELAVINTSSTGGRWMPSVPETGRLPELPRLRRFSNRARRVPSVATMRAAQPDRGFALASDNFFDTHVNPQISRRNNQQDQLFREFLESYSSETLAKVDIGEIKAKRCYSDLHFGLIGLHIKYYMRG